ncbi:tyrosine-type recombinase/integrase [Corynebacterium accolens]|uniref:tyrosine-type recombinase/integrase n=1 Tax=Corynebacterium accolens TaxID=38284 RepID=UPI002542AA8A|nr:tyrosine-type recombinase/integrase [Corynebacterium accolens]MDK4309499.1 tyrosine-type recombinase/integrase [Corynebacterium accolens]
MASIKPYKTAKGRAWRVQYRSPDGRNRTKQGFRTKNEAQAWADKNAVHMNEQDWIDPHAGKTTIGELGARWLGSQAHLKPSTTELYRQVWKSAVKPRWGTTPISTIKPSQVQEWVSTMGKSASWTRHAHNQLLQILDTAVSDRLIRTNPARGVKLPRKAPTVKVFWSMGQLKTFAQECGEREDLILLLGTSGLRWGEAIALRPCDLDPLRNRITITRNAAKVGNDVVVGTPKSHEARTVAVADHVMEKFMRRAGEVGRNDVLWTGRRGGWLRTPGHNTWFDGALKRAQAKDPTMGRVTPHGLRHVAAGLLVNAGANVLVVCRQLGHADPSITLRVYAELFEDGLDEVAATLDAGFSDVVELSCKDAKNESFTR